MLCSKAKERIFLKKYDYKIKECEICHCKRNTNSNMLWSKGGLFDEINSAGIIQPYRNMKLLILYIHGIISHTTIKMMDSIGVQSEPNKLQPDNEYVSF